jgi:hypothetical protein
MHARVMEKSIQSRFLSFARRSRNKKPPQARSGANYESHQRKRGNLLRRSRIRRPESNRRKEVKTSALTLSAIDGNRRCSQKTFADNSVRTLTRLSARWASVCWYPRCGAPQYILDLRKSFESIRRFANTRNVRDWRSACLICASGIALTMPTTRQHAVTIVCSSINSKSFPEIWGNFLLRYAVAFCLAPPGNRCDSRTIQSPYGRCGVSPCGSSGPSPFGPECG